MRRNLQKFSSKHDTCRKCGFEIDKENSGNSYCMSCYKDYCCCEYCGGQFMPFYYDSNGFYHPPRCGNCDCAKCGNYIDESGHCNCRKKYVSQGFAVEKTYHPQRCSECDNALNNDNKCVNCCDQKQNKK